ncbi:F0F1 ATP synthase subunit A [Yinghuangia aomiensis]
MLVAPSEFVHVFVTQPFTLAVRLFANMFASHMLLVTFSVASWYLPSPTVGVLFSTTSFVVVVLLAAFELFIQALQAYIFTLPAASYLASSLDGGHRAGRRRVASGVRRSASTGRVAGIGAAMASGTREDDHDGTLRLFVAVDPPSEAKAELRRALRPVVAQRPRLRWTDDGAWHVTLVFLGDVAAATVPALCEALGAVAARHAEFHLMLAGTDRFGAPHPVGGCRRRRAPAPAPRGRRARRRGGVRADGRGAAVPGACHARPVEQRRPARGGAGRRGTRRLRGRGVAGGPVAAGGQHVRPRGGPGALLRRRVVAVDRDPARTGPMITPGWGFPETPHFRTRPAADNPVIHSPVVVHSRRALTPASSPAPAAVSPRPPRTTSGA